MFPKYFKSKVDYSHFSNINPYLGIIFYNLVIYCKKNNLPLTVTSMMRTEEQNKAVGARSKTHVEGRAIDISTKGYTQGDIALMIAFLTKNFNKWAAISAKTGQPNLAYHHDNGNGPHIHIQCKPGLI